MSKNEQKSLNKDNKDCSGIEADKKENTLASGGLTKSKNETSSEQTATKTDDTAACDIKQSPRKSSQQAATKTDDTVPSESKKKSREEVKSKGYVFPSTLEEFGYQFIADELRSIETTEPFVFEVRKGDKEYNQKHYEALGEIITVEVYKLLETRGNLKKIIIPKDKKPKDAESFFFASEDAFNNEKLIILIHGSGVVRAGQWARRLIINDKLESGTQLPFIKRAAEEGYGVIVTNTNRNEEEIEGKKRKIKGSETPEDHAQYIWKHFISPANAKHIYIVAHSYGGVVTVELMKAFAEDFKKRVKRIAFTDSVHNLHLHGINGSMRRWITGNAINWVTSPKPLDTEVDGPRNDVPRKSAGTLKHEETSYFAFNSIFKYFSEQKEH